MALCRHFNKYLSFRSYVEFNNPRNDIKLFSSIKTLLSKRLIIFRASHHAALSFNPNSLDIDTLSENDARTGGPVDLEFAAAACDEHLRFGRSLPVVHHHGFVCEIPANNRFVMGKFDGLFNYLMMDGVIEKRQVVRPPPVPAAICALVHDPVYVHSFFRGLTTDEERRRTGFPWTPGLVRRCRLETGGTILACRLALETGIACSTGGGTHHAFPSFGAGYCLVNDIAIAARFMVASEMVEKILVVDLDVHQGDGTAFIFAEDPSVFTFSVHNAKNFPLRKQKSDLDISLEDGVGDTEYLQRVVENLPRIVDTFVPDLVIYDAGVDTHADDVLGRLSMTDQGIFDRDHYVLNHLYKRGIPVATVIGGGYSDWWGDVSLRHTIVHRAAMNVYRDK